MTKTVLSYFAEPIRLDSKTPDITYLVMSGVLLFFKVSSRRFASHWRILRLYVANATALFGNHLYTTIINV